MYVIIIGAGIGGLATGALLARRGESVTVLEAAAIPGGCASTFERGGCLFDAGATIGCGFHPGGPLHRLGNELGINWPVTPEPIAWHYASGDLSFALTSRRDALLERFPSTARFWQEQGRLARQLWQLAGGDLAWPPAGVGDWARMIGKGLAALPGSARLLPWLNRSAAGWLAARGLCGDAQFSRFIDAQLLISTQAEAAGTNALNAAIALDLPAAGTCSIKGGMGTIARLLAESIERDGGAVLYGQEVERIDTVGREVVGVETRAGGAFAADLVVANLTPRSLGQLDGLDEFPLPPDRHESPWSACTLYVDAPADLFAPLSCSHLQVVAPRGPLGEGNSIFVSASPKGDAGRAPEGRVALTLSTHSRPAPWFKAASESREAYLELKGRYTERMLDLLETALPGIRSRIGTPTAATPVSWERWTGRKQGLVGGYAQSTLFGLRGPETPWRNLRLVGDSIFPGQSLPGVVTGAYRARGR